MLKQVFDGQTANGDSLEIEHAGGEVEIVVAGTFDGASVELQAKYADVGYYVPISGGTWTAPLIRILGTIRKSTLKLVLSGAGASTDVDAFV